MLTAASSLRVQLSKQPCCMAAPTHGKPRPGYQCSGQLRSRVTAKAAEDDDVRQDNTADGASGGSPEPQRSSEEGLPGTGGAPQSRRAVVLQGAVAAGTAIGLQYWWLRTARPAGAAEDVCERAAVSAGKLREELSGPRLLKQQIYYPKWLFGEWQVTETYVGNPLMAGAPILAVHSMQASGRLVKPGDSVSFTQRFYSTLPDTFQNSFRMNVGQMPEDAIIADRAYNVAQAANAHGGYEVVTESAYDTREPGTQRMLFTGPAGGAPQLVQLQLAALKGSAPAADSDEGVAADPGRFCAREAYSQEQAGLQSDYEFLTTYTRVSDNHVTARQREVYYGPADGLAGVVVGRQPTAVFAYDLDLRRVLPPADAAGAASCVATPKGFTQCV